MAGQDEDDDDPAAKTDPGVKAPWRGRGAPVSNEFSEELKTHHDLRAALGIPIEKEPARAPLVSAPPPAGAPRVPAPRLPTDRAAVFVRREVPREEENWTAGLREILAGLVLIALLIAGTVIRRSGPSGVVVVPALPVAETGAQAEAPPPRSWKDAYAAAPPEVASGPPSSRRLAPDRVLLPGATRKDYAHEAAPEVPGAPGASGVSGGSGASGASGGSGASGVSGPAAAAPAPAPAPAPPVPSPSPAGSATVAAAAELPPTTQLMTILSSPPGAAVEVGGARLGVTPLIRQAPPGADQVRVRISLPGYRSVTTEVPRSADGHLNLSVTLEKL